MVLSAAGIPVLHLNHRQAATVVRAANNNRFCPGTNRCPRHPSVSGCRHRCLRQFHSPDIAAEILKAGSKSKTPYRPCLRADGGRNGRHGFCQHRQTDVARRHDGMSAGRFPAERAIAARCHTQYCRCRRFELMNTDVPAWRQQCLAGRFFLGHSICPSHTQSGGWQNRQPVH